MDVPHLTGPARESVVPREPMFDLAPEQRAEKPLWTLDEAFDAINAFEAAGAAVVQGEILAVAADGTVGQLPWEPWLPEDHDPRYPPGKRWWWLRQGEGEPWSTYISRSAAYARSRVRDLAGAARTTPAGTFHVDLAWITEDELALFDIPGWERPGRRRYIENGAAPREWLRGSSIRGRMIAGEAAPGSYHGIVAEDLDQIPRDARYAMVSLQADPSRLARFESLERLWAGGCTDDALPYVGRLPALRELCTFDDSRLSSLEPLAGAAGLEYASIHAGDELSDVRPLVEIPALRHLRLDALRMHDLSGAGRLTQLNTLNLSPERVVDSLEPLAALTNLRHLAVWMEEVREGGLAPLARLRPLRSLGVTPDDFPLEEFARLAVALPDTEGPHRAPFLPPDDPAYYRVKCRHCGRRDLRIPVGKPRRGLCPACSPDAIRRHVARWEILLSAAAHEHSGIPGR